VTAGSSPELQLTYDDLTRDPREVIGALRAALLRGEPWFDALLAAIRRWRVPHEVLDGRHYYYLIGGEAFDWLLLAERLLDAVADLVPADEAAELVFAGRLPDGFPADDLRKAIGPTKYRATLNFLYGVTVEEALQLSVEEDVQKEMRCRAWAIDPRYEESVFHRIYLKSREELLTAFRSERGLRNGESITFVELRELTYWLFKYRLKQCDPAKVAADTRRGLNILARLDSIRRRAPQAPVTEMPREFIDILL
jgi:hypothetical protein